MERFPRARGPNSHATVEDPDHVLLFDLPGDGLGPGGLPRFLVGIPFGLQVLLDVLRRELGTQVGPLHLVVDAVGLAGFVETVVPVGQGGPQGPTGVTRRGLDPHPVEDSLPENLPVGHAVEGDAPGQTQVPLPRDLPGVAGDLEHDLLGHVLDGAGDVHLAPGDGAFGITGRTAEQFAEPPVGHGESGEIVEVVLVETEGPVLLDVEELLLDEVAVYRLPVGGQPHKLVLPGVHPEPGEVGEGRVEQTQGVREPDLVQKPQAVSFAHPQGGGGPLPHPVQGEDGRILEGRGIEGACRVGFMVLGVVDGNGFRKTQLLEGFVDTGGHPELGPHPHGHRLHEGIEPLGRHREIGFQDAMELEDGLVVEDDRVGSFLPDPSLGQAVPHRVLGELGIVLLPGEPLFLGRGDDLAVVDQAGRGVVIPATDAQDLH